jgi:hypothetical protein
MTRAERIIEARRKLAAGEFDRAVTANEPYSLTSNQLTLECGHIHHWIPELRRNAPVRQRCDQCAEVWINAKPENNG